MKMTHTPAPWEAFTEEGFSGWYAIRQKETGCEIGSCDGGFEKADAFLMAAAPDLLDALEIVYACGLPEPVTLYDEEGVEGWRWIHPDGREWDVIGDWGDKTPMHPMACAAIDKAIG